MTLRFGFQEELAAEADRVARALHDGGLTVTSGDASAGGGLAALREGAIDLLLARGPAAVEACAGGRAQALAVVARDEPRDILVSAGGVGGTLASLPAGARVAVEGARRRSYLAAHRPDVVSVAPANGGGPVKAILSRSVDAAVIPLGGARALPLDRLASEILDPKSWVPGAGQGSRVLLGRAGAEPPAGIGALEDPAAGAAFAVEMGAAVAMSALGDEPAGFLAVPFGPWIRAWGMVASPDGRGVVRADLTGSTGDPRALGTALAERLLQRGAGLLGAAP